jgi:hypothetical protein
MRANLGECGVLIGLCMPCFFSRIVRGHDATLDILYGTAVPVMPGPMPRAAPGTQAHVCLV